MKKLPVSFTALALLVAGQAAAADLTVFGKWTAPDDSNCSTPFAVITAKTYQVPDGPPGRIKAIERNGNDFHIELSDGYAFTMRDVTDRSATWVSMATGDTFALRRCK